METRWHGAEKTSVCYVSPAVVHTCSAAAGEVVWETHVAPAPAGWSTPCHQGADGGRDPAPSWLPASPRHLRFSREFGDTHVIH